MMDLQKPKNNESSPPSVPIAAPLKSAHSSFPDLDTCGLAMLWLEVYGSINAALPYVGHA